MTQSNEQISEGAPELPNLPNLLLLNIRGGSISRNLAELEAIFQSYGAAREAHGRKKGLEEAAKAADDWVKYVQPGTIGNRIKELT